MTKLIYVKANAKKDNDSYSFKMANFFIEEYKKNNPKDEVVTLDLYKMNIPHLAPDTLSNMFAGKDNLAQKYAREFATGTKIVIAAPMWNFGLPSILKAYVDHIACAGVTFKYTDKGPVGLLADQNRKVLNITARGGSYSSGPYAAFEMNSSYLKNIMSFFGITNFETIALELTSVTKPEELTKQFEEKLEQIKIVARDF